MEPDYEKLMDDAQQVSAMIDRSLRERPDEEELKELQEFLADRYKAILFLRDG